MEPGERSKKCIYIQLRKLIIKNFKSIHELELELQPGLNVLVGSNASGKTNILEAVSFMYKALVEAAERIPYRPHAPQYWSPLDIVYMKDPNAVMALGMEFDIYTQAEDTWLRMPIGFTANLAYNPGTDTLEPTLYELNFGNATRIRISRHGIEVRIRRDVLEKAKEVIKNDGVDIELEYQEEDSEVIVYIEPEGARPGVLTPANAASMFWKSTKSMMERNGGSLKTIS
ncbi:AAA family ATPase [Pyrodictium abyssi]|uniref:Endonuclease GajA/Old nuclease/RecF-like AAA domain-containing protein n=1 Tax=Pyrodictium abyssi TaxID=54256 RepID=A0ABM8IWN1_9CREN|nr:hypothetical protein PABY_05420 [Pyrodictium abyssi]